MALAALSMIRDEADIIGPFLRHLAALFDIVFLFDQRSSDGSAEIMRRVCTARPNWFYYRVDAAGRHQKEIYNLFMKEAFARGAQTVFFVDSDEFVGVGSKAELAETSRRMNDSAAVGMYAWRPCVPSAFDRWHFDPLSPMWIARENAPWRKAALPRALFERMPGLRMSQGAHFGIAPDGTAMVDADIGHFFHVPLRSRQQFLQKVLVGSIGNFAKNNLMAVESWHKRQMLDLIATHELSDDLLASIAGKYAELPEFRLWARHSDMSGQGFEQRPMNVPLADLDLPVLPRPDLAAIVARCVRDFQFENVEGGEGSLVVDGDTITFRPHDPSR